MKTLFTTCDENDYDVRLTVEENLNEFVKNLKEVVLTRSQVELHRTIKHNPNVGPNALKDQLFEHQNQNTSTYLIIGYLSLIKNLIQLLGIKLLEDSIQHTTSSCILAKVSLAQLIDDIDFRILTYLEQQQKQLKQQYPDIRVRQVTASTFANLKKYINTNESDFQAAVLDLLVQLLLICHYIYCIAEFLIMLSHDTLHSKRVIKIQDLIKHYDSLLTSGHEPETHALAALEPVLYDFFLDQSLLDIYSTQLTLFDVVSSVALRSIDPFVVAFRALANRNVRCFYL
ncbi:unnamed protein product [Rotaria sp. Silwood1]|nr:unnamed protein product [Rotaria sp. Silwood1]CAF1652767.1 unnamed protein product [Rotaria sp. Silwood1]